MFISYPGLKNRILAKCYKPLFILIALATSGYLVFGYDIFKFRIGSAIGYEVVLGILAIILVLESTRLTTGMGLVVVAIVFMFYTYFGSYIPGLLHVSGGTVTLISGQTYLGLMGIYGVPMGVILDYIFVFLLFGFILEAVGGMKFFIQVANTLFGKMRGASAKVAIVLNMFVGMVQGSTIAAVLLTGPLTIPQIRKEGYSERFIGGIIASAANAAQLMPPVMGIVAFVMANFLGIPYIHLCFAAFIPGALYYLCLFVASDLEAARKKIRPVPVVSGSEIPLGRLVIKNWHCILSFVLLIALLVSQVITVRLAVMVSSLALLASSYLRKETRPSFENIRNIVRDTSKGLVAIGPVCAAAGIVIASIGMTALDYKFSVGLTEMAGGNLLLLLVFATIACFILGMGIPTLPAYIVVVLLITPPLIQSGIPPIAVHMFVFYMALTAMITPPVALNVYAVAPMVKSSLWPIGLTAMGIALAQWILPFLFVYNPALLLVGGVGEIIWAIFSAVILILALCFALSRYGLTNANWLEMLFAVAGGVLISFPIGGLVMDAKIIGGILLLIVIASQVRRRARSQTPR